MNLAVVTFEGYDKYVLRGEASDVTFVVNLNRVSAVVAKERQSLDFGDYYEVVLSVGDNTITFDVADRSTVESIMEIWQDTQ